MTSPSKRFVTSFALCLALARCAPATAVLPIAASLPASAPAPVFDFEEIPPGACVPPFVDGLYVSWPSARNLVIAHRQRERDHKLAMIEIEEKAALAESRAASAEKVAAAADSWLSRYGLLVGFGAGVLSTMGVAAAAWALSR